MSLRGACGIALAARDDPDGVNDPWDVSQKRQHDVDPELKTNADLQKHAKRRQYDRKNDTHDIHDRSSFSMMRREHRSAEIVPHVDL